LRPWQRRFVFARLFRGFSRARICSTALPCVYRCALVAGVRKAVTAPWVASLTGLQTCARPPAAPANLQMRTIGPIVKPVTGMGGSIEMKGSDGEMYEGRRRLRRGHGNVCLFVPVAATCSSRRQCCIVSSVNTSSALATRNRMNRCQVNSMSWPDEVIPR
jgi:hypothetical protein